MRREAHGSTSNCQTTQANCRGASRSHGPPWTLSTKKTNASLATPLTAITVSISASLRARSSCVIVIASSLYHCILVGLELDAHSYCGVFGDGENGAYEWFVWRKGVLETSDVAYGIAEIALRDVLNKAVV